MAMLCHGQQKVRRRPQPDVPLIQHEPLLNQTFAHFQLSLLSCTLSTLQFTGKSEIIFPKLRSPNSTYNFVLLIAYMRNDQFVAQHKNVK